MCLSAIENSHVERVQGTIKNQYLKYWDNSSLTKLGNNLATAVERYNYQRPHASLNGLTPVEFETQLQGIPIEKRTKMTIFTNEQPKQENLISNQLELCF
jgi:hypothetical protein